MGNAGVSVMTYVRLDEGRPNAAATVNVVGAVPGVLGVDATRVVAAIHRSRSGHAALALSRGLDWGSHPNG
jgi:hypothetical protein